MAKPAQFSWQQPLAALFGGISAAGQPGGWSNFGAGVNQVQQQQQQAATAQQMAELRQMQIEQAQEEMRRSELEREQEAALQRMIQQQLGGVGHPVRQIGDVPGRTVGGAPGQSALLSDMNPQQSALFSTYAQIDPKRAIQMLTERAFAEPEAEKLTDDQREYRFAQSQGYKGSFLDFVIDQKRAGASSNPVTIYNKDYGSIPPGHRLVEGPDGVRLEALPVEALPGSPAAAEADAAAAADAATTAKKQQTGSIVIQDIDRALKLVDEAKLPTTGMAGDILSNIGGTAARDVKALTDTIKANAGFAELQTMRDQSPTGGALGQVTERELALLQAVIGNLEQSQSTDQFKDNLRRVKNVYLDIVHGPGKGPARERLGFEGNVVDELPPGFE